MIFIHNSIFAIFDINFGQLQQPVPLWVVILAITLASAVAIIVSFLRWGKEIIPVVQFIESKRSDAGLRKEQKIMSNTIKQKFSQSKLKINEDAGFEVLPYDLEIKWRNKSDVKAFLHKDTKVIIVMRDSEDQAENFTKAVEAYVEKSVIPRTRKYVPREVMRAVELTVTKKIINIEFDTALGYYDENIYKPAIQKNQDLNIFMEALATLDFRGLFTRVFLRELYDFGLKMHPQLSNESIKDETKQFMGFFTGIARKPEGDKNTQTVLEEKHLRIGIVYVAGNLSSKEVANMILNIENCKYARYVDGLLARHINTVILLARGEKYMGLTRELLRHYSKNVQVSSTDEVAFEDYSTKTSAIVGRIKMKNINS